MERFHAILLREFEDYERGAIIDVMSGGDGFAGRWLVLVPATLAGKWIVPWLDADVALTLKEAANVLSVRRGRDVPARTVLRYLNNGTLQTSGHDAPSEDRARTGRHYVARSEVWAMPFPKPGRPWPEVKDHPNQEK